MPLSPAAVAALDEARSYGDGSGLVFPSPTGRTLSSGVLSRFTHDEDFTPHGLRASFRTWCAETGVPREVAEAALAHPAGIVERAYQRSDLLDARREVMDAWARELVAAGPRLPPGPSLGDKSRTTTFLRHLENASDLRY